MRTVFSETGGNSIFNVARLNSFFCSDFFPAAMALHNGHGCLPSNVRETDSEKDSVVKLAASIVVQAIVCKVAQ